MSELFGIPERKDTTLNKVGRFLSGFGAGYQGRGAEFLAQQDQRQQQLDERRQKAMARDAMRVYSQLNDGKYDDAIELIDDRVKSINELGGDASDTLEIRNLIVSGRLDEAQQELGGFLELAMQNGLIEAPKAPEIVPASSIVNGQVVTRDSAGNLMAQRVLGFEAEEQNRQAANMGLSPVWLQDESGQYVPAQLSSAGGITPTALPQGMRAVPPSGQLAFDPNAIAQRGAAETNVDVANVQALTGPGAEREAAQRRATAAVDRSQGVINAGMEAASSIPVVQRSLDLLNEVKTGGYNAAAIRARSLFGVESADEGELVYNLARNVLQQLRPIFGAAFTAAEGQRLENIEAGLGRNTETNIRLLNQVLDVAQRSARKAYDRAYAEGDMNTAIEIDRALRSIGGASQEIPPIPAQYSDQITPEIWQSMTTAQRAAFQ
jgi:hypothetical protein